MQTDQSTGSFSASEVAQGDRLGKYTKSATPPTIRSKIQATRSERFELLSGARALYLWAGKRQGLEHPHNFHRTAKCKWITHAGAVGVHQSMNHGSAFYTGLMSCASVWTCPVCAVKIQERRREEIEHAINWAYRVGLQPVMVTLTFPHRSWFSLENLLDQQADALHRLRAGEPWKRFKDFYAFKGLIRSLELTFGSNGWHPHTHELWFVASDAKADEMKEKIIARWRNSCIRAGLLDPHDAKQIEAFDAHAVDVKGNCQASDYLAKQDDSRHWGADRELAKSSTKAGRKKGMHPFGLLAEASDGDKKSAMRFLRYTEAIKGKRQIYWSPGLKDLVGIADLTEQQIVDRNDDKADLLGLLGFDDWKAIRSAGKRAQVLDAAENGGWVAVLKLVASLKEKRPKMHPPSEYLPF